MHSDLSRRSFLRGSAVTTAGATMVNATSALLAQAETAESTSASGGGPDAVPITLQVNGVARALRVEPRTTLAEALRGPLGLTGTKIACDRGACSACTVWLDGATGLLLHDARHRCRHAPRHDDRGSGAGRHAASGASRLHRARRAAMRLLHARHGDELRGAAGAHARIRLPTTSAPRSAAISAAAAPIRMSSPRRSRPPRREGLTMAARRQPCAPRHFRSASPASVSARCERQIPADEPPPLPPNAELAVIGKPVPRQNGRAKVTGADPLHGRCRAARHAACPDPALAAAACAGPRDRHLGRRAPSRRARDRADRRPDDPQSAIVRYVGAPVAAVAAVSTAAAEEALRLIRVDYQPLPFVVDMDQARAPTAPAGLRKRGSAPGGHPSGWPAPQICRSTAMCADRPSAAAAT